jgi:hypothetical protein
MIFHGINEIQLACKKCKKETISKILSVPVMINKAETDKLQVGRLTQEYIEANKEILQQERQNALEEEYE